MYCYVHNIHISHRQTDIHVYVHVHVYTHTQTIIIHWYICTCTCTFMVSRTLIFLAATTLNRYVCLTCQVEMKVLASLPTVPRDNRNGSKLLSSNLITKGMHVHTCVYITYMTNYMYMYNYVLCILKSKWVTCTCTSMYMSLY